MSSLQPPQVHHICPRCALTITPRTSWMTIRHCPRCLAQSASAIDMFTSPVPAATLYGDNVPSVPTALS